MSGIFISYASQDREKAEVLARALEQKGWPVWWDRQIPFGKSFDQEIEDNLAKAKCVLVLWTRVSVDSRWVRSEASEAAARGVLVPVLFEPDVKIPLEFKLLQAVNLSDWHVNAEHREFAALVAQIADMLGAATPAESRRRRRHEPVPPLSRSVRRSPYHSSRSPRTSGAVCARRRRPIANQSNLGRSSPTYSCQVCSSPSRLSCWQTGGYRRTCCSTSRSTGCLSHWRATKPSTFPNGRSAFARSRWKTSTAPFLLQAGSRSGFQSEAEKRAINP